MISEFLNVLLILAFGFMIGAGMGVTYVALERFIDWIMEKRYRRL